MTLLEIAAQNHARGLWTDDMLDKLVAKGKLESEKVAEIKAAGSEGLLSVMEGQLSELQTRLTAAENWRAEAITKIDESPLLTNTVRALIKKVLGL